MMFPALKEAIDKLDEKQKTLHTIFAEAGPDMDLDKVKSLSGDAPAKVAEIQKINAELDELGAEVERLQGVAKAAERVAQMGDPASEDAGESGDGSQPGRKDRKAKSFGEQWVESDAFKGYVPGSGMGPVSRFDLDLKTLFETAAGWDPFDARSARVEMIATRPAPIVADFVPQTETGQSTVKYMEETTFTNNAAEAAEGGTYGEAALVLTEKSSEVRKIAVWLPVTDEQFEDEPRARSYVERRLPFMIQQRLDSQILVGNGTAPNLRGTENVSGIQTQALGTDPIPDAVFKVMRKIRDDGFAMPNVIFIAPSKWETVRLLRTTDGLYIWGNPSEPGPERMWGLPVVQTTAVTATKVVVGDYLNYSELAVRRGIDVQVSNSHSTHFVEGKLAIRADVRVALIHYRPKAFGTVTGL